MLIKENDYLKRDTKGKIRHSSIALEEYKGVYSITGCNGLFNGQHVPRPTITITSGKAKRTPLEQAKLQYESECKKVLDKGYKEISQLGIDPEEFTRKVVIDVNHDMIIDEFSARIEALVPKEVTDTKGARKPMLAKSYKDLNKPEEFYNKYWFASTKLDGVRCSIYKDENGNLVTSSRGGQDYNVPATYILQDEKLKGLFDIDPNLILDGELYIHGRPLSYISGLCRRKDLCEGHKELKFYCYDMVDETKTFSERKESLEFMRPFILDSDKIIIIDQVEVYGWNNIIALHDKWVADGYEGLVMRDPNDKYKCGARDTRMIKVKMFEDDEFKITGLQDGLRDEDLCFTLETKEGYPFKAKPMGDRKMKQWYRDHINELIGKMGTVKYFHYSTTEHPVPNLPVFKCVRDIKDMDL